MTQLDLLIVAGEYILARYQQHLVDYDQSKIRDFADALIAAKVEAIDEQRDSAEHLNDDNLGLVLMDM